MILGLVEHDRGTLEETSLQMIAFGRDAAARMDTPFTAVLMGEPARPLAEALRAYGVSSALLARHDGLDDYAPVAWAEVPGPARGGEAAGHDHGRRHGPGEER